MSDEKTTQKQPIAAENKENDAQKPRAVCMYPTLPRANGGIATEN